MRYDGLELDRAGSGNPSVVFLPGAGLVGLDYLNIHERAAELTTSVRYDRGGTGWSETATLPRGAAEVAEELHALLHAAAVPGPHLLVGHSLGAFYARRFAQLFPAEVAGLLLVDPGHEDIFSFLPPEAVELNERMKPDLDSLPDLTDEQVEASRAAFGKLFAGWPDAARDRLTEHHLATWRTGILETLNFESELYPELRAGGPLPDVPLIVLTAAGRNPYWAQFLTEEQMRMGHDGIDRMHRALAASVPRGEQRTVAGASHQFLHLEHADAVVRAIRDLIEEA